MRLFEGTEYDRIPQCERCEKPECDCKCSKLIHTKVPNQQTARVDVEKRKKGKIVTVIRGLNAVDNNLPAIHKMLKSGCGAGGTCDGDVLEIQGEQLERVRVLLTEAGFRIKK